MVGKNIFIATVKVLVHLLLIAENHHKFANGKFLVLVVNWACPTLKRGVVVLGETKKLQRGITMKHLCSRTKDKETQFILFFR